MLNLMGGSIGNYFHQIFVWMKFELKVYPMVVLLSYGIPMDVMAEALHHPNNSSRNYNFTRPQLKMWTRDYISGIKFTTSSASCLLEESRKVVVSHQ